MLSTVKSISAFLGHPQCPYHIHSPPFPSPSISLRSAFLESLSSPPFLPVPIISQRDQSFAPPIARTMPSLIWNPTVNSASSSLSTAVSFPCSSGLQTHLTRDFSIFSNAAYDSGRSHSNLNSSCDLSLAVSPGRSSRLRIRVRASSLGEAGGNDSQQPRPSLEQAMPSFPPLVKGVIPVLRFGTDGNLVMDNNRSPGHDISRGPGSVDKGRSMAGTADRRRDNGSTSTSTAGRTSAATRTRAAGSTSSPAPPSAAGPISAASVPKWTGVDSARGGGSGNRSESGGQRKGTTGPAVPKYSKASRRFFNDNFRKTERLGKVLALAGVASRRGSEAVIVAGRVTVNGQVCLVPQTGVDVQRDTIYVDGHSLPKKAAPKLCFVVNKPKGYICSSTAQGGSSRPALELVEEYMKVWEARNSGLPRPRLFTVGRLDVNTTGLLLITNDGDLAQLASHPSNGMTKEYIASVDGKVSKRQLAAMADGVMWEGVRLKPLEVELVESEPGIQRQRIRIVVGEGRYHEVRNIVQEGAKMEVKALKRIRIGGLRLSRKLALGQFEVFSPSQLTALLLGKEGAARTARKVNVAASD
eukprot:TRINITY_DN10938_c0_g3_i1.p1 TRINITY_DN10938_c0_g3~~TRINITY_DN10938_c0_g3_i1.p1  ORF type:complete len:584 (+),score=75.39 TRINITY_DN10938_c0_g3_i1:322-2073(+)